MQVKRGRGRPRRPTLAEMKAAQAKNKKTEEVGLGEGQPIPNNLRELKRLYRIKMAGS